MAAVARPARDRFLEKINKLPGEDGCWEWTGAPRTDDGYGIFQGKSAHRFSYELHFGTIPHGLCICHSCDNPKCVRPDHLFAGTHAQNMQDCIRKGRFAHPIGERNGRTKITEAIATSIIDNSTETQSQIAQRLGISPSLVSYILSGKRWGHVTRIKGAN